MSTRLLTTKRIRSIVKTASKRYDITIKTSKTREYSPYSQAVWNYGKGVRRIEYFIGAPDRKNINDFFNDMYENPEIPSWFRFAPGVNYIIPKEYILKYSKKFYQRILDILEWDVIVGEAHMIERALWTIFHNDWIVKEEYR